jgi:hypothetical protein
MGEPHDETDAEVEIDILVYEDGIELGTYLERVALIEETIPQEVAPFGFKRLVVGKS